MDRPERVTGVDKALGLVQERVANAAERKKSPFEDGRELRFSFDADAGDLTVRRMHGLGRKPTGWIVTDVETNNVLGAASLIRTMSNKFEIELQLVSDGTGQFTYRIWVY